MTSPAVISEAAQGVPTVVTAADAVFVLLAVFYSPFTRPLLTPMCRKEGKMSCLYITHN